MIPAIPAPLTYTLFGLKPSAFPRLRERFPRTLGHGHGSSVDNY